MEITIFTIIVLLFSLIIHEISHGGVANWLGDSTAKDQGRLTLNPIKHIDPFGSIILPILAFIFTAGQGPIFGFAKPVPINPYNLKDQKWGTLKIAIAGPLANFLVAIIFGLLIRFSVFPGNISSLFSIIVSYNLLWGLFNLVPIPPLDGSHILFRLLPNSVWKLKIVLQQYGMFILLFFLFFGLKYLTIPIIFLYNLIVGGTPIFF